MVPRARRRHRDTLMFAVAYAVIAAAVLFAIALGSARLATKAQGGGRS